MRMMIEYYQADRLWYAVAGTPNRLKYSLDFFAKNGDGSADFKPIAHLYKSQVYQLGPFLGVPEEILRRSPTTHTYSLAQSQEDSTFLFHSRKWTSASMERTSAQARKGGAAAGLTAEQVKRVFAAIDSKLKATAYPSPRSN